MAHQLATDTSNPKRPKFRVLGIIFIDSVYPRRFSEFPELAGLIPAGRIVKTPAELKAMKLKEKVDLNMAHARVMVQTWDVPQWKGVKVPPTILLRAKQYVVQSKTSIVDHSRQDRLLGWEAYSKEHGDFITEVVDIEGHHFSIFEERYVSSHKHCESDPGIFC